MTKYRPYSRRWLKRRFFEWVKSNQKVVIILTAGMVALLAVVTAWMIVIMPSMPFSWWALGAVQTGVVAMYLYMLHTAFLAHDLEALRHLRGAWGEENARDELQKAKRKRLIWGWVDSISLQAGDIDHLVVTLHGGLVAVDSKWRTEALPRDTKEMAQAANKAKLRAEALTHTLLKRERGARHRGSTNPLHVTPVVVLWGASQHGVPEGAHINGVDFVPGLRFRRWLGGLQGQPVSQEAATDALNRLTAYRATTWEATTAPRR